MKKRKNYNRWVHYRVGDYKEFGFVAICGRESPQCEHLRTSVLNKVTCPRCIEELKKSHWYCPNHGFITDEHITDDGKCKMCGSLL